MPRKIGLCGARLGRCKQRVLRARDVTDRVGERRWQQARRGARKLRRLSPLWERLEAQIDWYDRKATANQRAYKASKVAIIVLAIAIPILAEYGAIPGLHDTRALLVGIAAGAILCSKGCSSSTSGRRTGSSIARPAKACATSSISSARRPALTPTSSPRRRRGLLAERAGALVIGRALQMGPRPQREDRDHRHFLRCTGSQETIRIDIDHEADIAFGLGRLAEPEPQIGLEVGLAGGLDQEAIAVAAADHRKRRLRRPQHLDLGGRRRGAGDRAGVAFGRLARARRSPAARQAGRRAAASPSRRAAISRSRNASRSPETSAWITGCSGI